MDKELSKEEVQAQIDAKEREISDHARVLEHEAKYFGILAKERVDLFKEQAKNNALAIGGGIVGGGLLLKMLLGGKNDGDGADAYRRELDGPYVASLAYDVETALDEGETLHDALLQALRERAPLLLENPERHSGGFWSGLLKLGLVAGVAFGANFAAEYLTGRNLVDLVKEQAGGGDFDAGDLDAFGGAFEPDVEPAYAPVHGTAGAEMPETESFGPVSPQDVPSETGPAIDDTPPRA